MTTMHERGPLPGPSLDTSSYEDYAVGRTFVAWGALLPLGRLELDLRTFGQGLEALAGDAAVV
jgi:hypothetical protein